MQLLSNYNGNQTNAECCYSLNIMPSTEKVLEHIQYTNVHLLEVSSQDSLKNDY